MSLAIFFEIGNLNGLIFLLAAIMLGPAILLAIIGGVLFSNQKRKAGKVLFILAGVYLVISLGTCGVLMTM